LSSFVSEGSSEVSSAVSTTSTQYSSNCRCVHAIDESTPPDRDSEVNVTFVGARTGGGGDRAASLAEVRVVMSHGSLSSTYLRVGLRIWVGDRPPLRSSQRDRPFRLCPKHKQCDCISFHIPKWVINGRRVVSVRKVFCQIRRLGIHINFSLSHLALSPLR
jgi:hypothetical protein